MADSSIAITAGSGTTIDTRTEGTNSNHRQVVVLGDPATNAGVAPVDATAGLKVDLGADNDVTVTGTVTANLSATDNAVLDTIDANTDYGVVVGGGAEATALRVTIASDSTGVLSVDDNGGALTVDGTVTANAGTNLNTSALALETGGNLATIAGDTTSIDGKITACNTGAVTISAALPAGTNAIGKLAANSGVDIGDVDITSIAAGDNNIGNVDIASIAAGDNNIGNVDIVTLPNAVVDGNYFTATITSANASSATAVKAKTADKKIYVTSLMISVGSTALEVQLQSDNGTPQVVMEEIFLAANGGLTMSACDPKLPLFVVNTNEDLDVITSAAGDITVLVSGYVAT